MSKDKFLVFSDTEAAEFEKLMPMPEYQNLELEIHPSGDVQSFDWFAKQFKYAFVDWMLFDQWGGQPFKFSELAYRLLVFDCIERKGNNDSTSLIATDAIRLAIVKAAKNLQNRMPFFISGDGPLARICAFSAFQLGFKRIIFVSPERDQLDRDIQILQKSMFGAEFEILPPESLTNIKVSGAVLINTLRGEKKSILLEDLSYFNYMQPQALVLDLDEVSDNGDLLEEAKKADLVIVPKSEVFKNYLKIMTRV